MTMSSEDLANKLFNDAEYQAVIEMLKMTPNNPTVLFYAALSHSNLGQELEALKLLKQALAFDPEHEQTLRQLAWMLTDDIERLMILERLARTGKAESDDLALMGDLYNEHNRLHDAHYWFHQALDKEPKNSLALIGLSEVYVKLAIRFMRETEFTQDLDLSEQMSKEREVEDVMRFIYDDVVNRQMSYEQDDEPSLDEFEDDNEEEEEEHVGDI